MTKHAEIRLACRMIEQEALRAIEIFPSFNSGHEGKSVIEEELDELWVEVKKYPNADKTLMAKEAVQLGAMAARFIADICLPDFEESDDSSE